MSISLWISVISSIMDSNRFRMIEAMIKGMQDPHKLAALADKQLKAKTPQALVELVDLPLQRNLRAIDC